MVSLLLVTAVAAVVLVASGAVWWSDYQPLAAVGGRLPRRAGTPLREYAARVFIRIVGSRETAGLRLLALAVVMFFMAVIGVLFLLVRLSLPLTTESGPILRTLVKYGSSTYLYGVLGLIAAAMMLRWQRDRMAAKTASETNSSKQAVKRYAAEVRSTAAAVGLYGSTDHSEQQLRAKLMRAFNGDAADEAPREEATPAAGGELADPVAGALPANDASPTATADAPVESDSTDNGESLNAVVNRKLDAMEDDIDRLHAEFADPSGSLAALIFDDVELPDRDRIAARRNRIEAEYTGLLDAALGDDLTEYCLANGMASVVFTHGARAADHTATLAQRAHEGDGRLDASETTDETALQGDSVAGAQQSATAQLAETLRAFRKQVAATASLSNIVYQLLLPAGFIMFLGIVALETVTLSPVGYVLLGAMGLVIGTGYYGGRRWQERRAVQSARADSDTSTWSDSMALAKPIEDVDGGRDAYVVFVGGRVLFDHDKHRLARTTAKRWHQLIHGDDMWPAQQEQWATDAAEMLPFPELIEWNDSEYSRGAVYDEILDEVRENEYPPAMVPKYQLAERVASRAPDGRYDPELIGECYLDLLGPALWEIDVPVQSSDGEMRDVTVVYLREMGLPESTAEIRAQFHGDFDPDAEPTYPLPERPDLSASWDPAVSSHIDADSWTTAPS